VILGIPASSDRGGCQKVVFVPFNEAGRPLGNYQDFLTGFLLDPQVPATWGRPVGLLVLPDGSILVTEEANNRIYRIQYPGQRDSSKG
jgi:glucose/arabinose dehydrogenase